MRQAEVLLRKIDHTLLRPAATWNEIKILCEQAVQGGAASVCIPPGYVSRAHAFLAGSVKVCTVIGFPNGYHTTLVKCFEAERAVLDGADELDMVINLGMVKEKRFDLVEDEIRKVRKACPGRVLKVIIETAALTQEEKIALCDVVSRSEADFIKTSTGFGGGGATIQDVALLKAHVAPHVGVKASGGIRTVEFAWELIEHGADRIGSSAVLPFLLDGAY